MSSFTEALHGNVTAVYNPHKVMEHVYILMFTCSALSLVLVMFTLITFTANR